MQIIIFFFPFAYTSAFSVLLFNAENNSTVNVFFNSRLERSMCEGIAQNEAVFRPRPLDADRRLHHRFPEVPWKTSQNFPK